MRKVTSILIDIPFILLTFTEKEVENSKVITFSFLCFPFFSVEDFGVNDEI